MNREYTKLERALKALLKVEPDLIDEGTLSDLYTDRIFESNLYLFASTISSILKLMSPQIRAEILSDLLTKKEVNT
jgi:hypothetical protein